MGLAVTANLDPVTLFTTGNYDSNGGAGIGELGSVAWAGAIFYYDRLDFFAGYWAPGTGAGDSVRWDPLLVDNVGALFDDVAGPLNIGGSGNSDRFAVGEWDRAANTQKLYQFANSNGTNAQFNEIQPLAFNQVVTSNPFPALGQINHRGSLISTDPGYYDQAGLGGWVFFETWGYAFAPNVRVRNTDAVQYAGVPALINLATGAAEIIAGGEQGFFTAFGTQTHFFSEPSLFGQLVDFTRCQFVPDDSSTPAQPRGALYLFSTGANSPDDAAKSRFWAMAVDWNPFDVSATPSRVHLRRRLLSAVDLTKASGGTLSGIYESGTPISKGMFYHPRTNRLFFNSSDGIVAGQLQAGDQKFLLISPTPSVASILEPSATEEISSGKTTEFSVSVVGSLQEQIGGVDIGFTLQRVSTIGEVLAVTYTLSEVVAVANGPISPTDPNLSPVVVYKDGTPMVEGGGATEYAVNRGAGTIDFGASEPVSPSIYTIDYRHFATPTTPPTGAALLNSSATSDISGAAIARVRHDEEDPVEDRWFRIDATQI